MQDFYTFLTRWIALILTKLQFDLSMLNFGYWSLVSYMSFYYSSYFFSIFRLTKFLISSKIPSIYLRFILFESFKINTFSPNSQKYSAICSAKSLFSIYFFELHIIDNLYICLSITNNFNFAHRMKNCFNIIFP